MPGTSEQVIYNPIAYKGLFVVNTTIPASNAIASCSSNTDTGYTLFLSVSSGGAVTGLFTNYNDAGGFLTDGSGSVFFANAGGKDYFLTQTTDGNGAGSGSGGSGGGGSGGGPGGSCPAPLHWSNGTCTGPANPPGPTGNRLTWIQKR